MNRKEAESGGAAFAPILENAGAALILSVK